MFGRRQLRRSSVILLTDRMTERTITLLRQDTTASVTHRSCNRQVAGSSSGRTLLRINFEQVIKQHYLVGLPTCVKLGWATLGLLTSTVTFFITYRTKGCDEGVDVNIPYLFHKLPLPVRVYVQDTGSKLTGDSRVNLEMVRYSSFLRSTRHIIGHFEDEST